MEKFELTNEDLQIRVGADILTEMQKDLALIETSPMPKKWYGMIIIPDPSLPKNEFVIELRQSKA